MIKEAIETLFAKADALKDTAAKVDKVELGGLPFIHHGETLKELRQPEFPMITMTTLAGLVDAVKGGLVEKPLCVIVDGPTCAVAVTAPVGAWLQRRQLARAVVDTADGKFPWGQWMEADDFVIGLQAKFGPTEDRDRLVRTLGNLQGGIVRTSTDDGISQTVSVKAGVSLLGEEKIVNPVTLRPYRTFSDLEQPASPFVLRIKQDKDCAPKIALFEADGGLWKRAAVDAAHKFLTAAGLGCPVLR